MFDSSRANRAYYDHILEAFRLPPMDDRQFAYAHMHTVHETLAYLIPDPDLLAKAHEYRVRLRYEPFIRYMVIEPHLRDMLARLRPKYKLAVATNRTDSMAGVLAEHGLADAFDLVITARDVVNPKPHPEPLFKVIEYFGIAPLEMIFVGDSELDSVAAQAAGVPFISYANHALIAGRYIRSLKEIVEMLQV